MSAMRVVCHASRDEVSPLAKKLDFSSSEAPHQGPSFRPLELEPTGSLAAFATPGYEQFTTLRRPIGYPAKASVN